MDTMSEKTIRILVVIFALSSIFLLLQNSKLREDMKDKEFQANEAIRLREMVTKKYDSLQSEYYPTAIELNRYETAFYIFSQRNPCAASEYGDIISNETE